MNEQNNVATSRDDKMKKISSEVFESFETFVYGCCILLFLLTFVFRICRVDGPSMNQTLHHGDMLIISNLFYEPEQYDVIVFHQTDNARAGLNETIVKRIIATSGHYVKIDYDKNLVYISDDRVFDEGDLIDESMYKYLDSGRWNRSGVYETYVPEGKLFVMGDNRNHSTDSRSNDIGLVDSRRVLGKVIGSFWPFSDARTFG